jgi:transposase
VSLLILRHSAETAEMADMCGDWVLFLPPHTVDA